MYGGANQKITARELELATLEPAHTCEKSLQSPGLLLGAIGQPTASASFEFPGFDLTDVVARYACYLYNDMPQIIAQERVYCRLISTPSFFSRDALWSP